MDRKKIRRETVEEDLQAGPLMTKELFHKNLSAELMESGITDTCADETYVFADLYRYRIIIGRYDTTAQVWDIVKEDFHKKVVSVGRYFIERDMKLSGDAQMMSFIEQKCRGPHGVEDWLAFCREKGYATTTDEDGPARDDLVGRLHKKEAE